MKKKKSGSLIVISGPSGVGKDTICNELVRKHNEICLSISMTTRERRGNEVDGENYFFVTKDDFIKNIENVKYFLDDNKEYFDGILYKKNDTVINNLDCKNVKIELSVRENNLLLKIKKYIKAGYKIIKKKVGK